ncbi:MAG: peptidoglycan DD-metalloendopeptidase family protein [Agathobaculum sp.]|uniref:peptidoglycan DD-metalloendopeptidase family protein n=1 Tax=Agathobaculum sp. TaxID=2048138 RepID=UPI0025C5E528|nr:peptidoglycan DD-metalloendopeptidase family protein [Agathobaculum sp.]MCI7125890.1 peptidoglycan DD-metalloendopeptidase family protein [Agathobaculum sp.]
MAEKDKKKPKIPALTAAQREQGYRRRQTNENSDGKAKAGPVAIQQPETQTLGKQIVARQQTTQRTSGGFGGGGKNSITRQQATQAARPANGYAPTAALRLSDDRQQSIQTLGKNMTAWHTADAAKKQQLEAENAAIRARLGLGYDARTGVTIGQQGENLSLPVLRMTSGTPAARARAAVQEAQNDTPRQATLTAAANAAREASYDRQTPLSALGHNTMAGVAGISKGFYDTVDFLLPDVITPKRVQQYIDKAKEDNARIIEQVNQYNAARGGRAGAFAGSLYQSAIGMVPQAVVAIMTGGVGAAGEMGKAGAQLAAASKPLLTNITQKLAQNAPAMTSFLSTVGSDYEQAKAGGASDAQAAISAVISSAINAGIEVGGGIETAAGAPATWKNILKSMHEEGMEEVTQGIVSGLTQKSVYDHDKPWVTAGGDGVIDPARMAQEYGAGALLAGGAGAARAVGARIVSGDQTVRTDDTTNRYLQAKQAAQEVNSQMQAEQKASLAGAELENNRTLNQIIAENHDTIAQTGVLAEMTGKEFSGGERKLVDQITDFFKSIGNKVTRVGFGDVVLNRSGARDSISHGIGRNKAIAFAAVPSVIENGTVIDMQHDWKGRGYDTATFGGRVRIGGIDYDMGVIVKQYDNAENRGKYYLHEVLLTNQESEAVSFKTGTNLGYPSDTASLPENSIPQSTREVNSQMQAEQAAREQGARMAALDAERRQAEGMLPGPARDAALRRITEQMQQEAGAPRTAAEVEADMRAVADLEKSDAAQRAANPYYGLTRQQLEMELDFARQQVERARENGRGQEADRFLGQYRQIETALADAKKHTFRRGDRVFALDRNNFGEIVRDRGDGYFDVYFARSEDEANGIHTLHGDLLQAMVPEEQRVQATPQEVAERSGEALGYDEADFDHMVETQEVDQYAPLPPRDYSRFGGEGRGLKGGDEQIRRDIQEITEQADEQGSRQIIPESVALAINPVKGAYNKTLERVLDQAAGKNQTVRTFLRDVIERPLAKAKGLYAKNIKSQMEDYRAAIQKTGITKGSKESAAVMWYGEGKRMNEAGDYVDYTLKDLKQDFPETWRQIVEADAVNRAIYDSYIEKIQQARREVYPYAEQRVELAIARKRAQAAAYSEQVRALDAKIKAGTATGEETESRTLLMRMLQETEKDIIQRQRDRDSGKAFANQRLFPRKDYYHHTMEMAEGFAALKNIFETDADIDPRLVGTSDHTKPNAKWSGVLQKRQGVRTMEDSVACMLDYIPQAEYMINIDPQIARLRTVVRDLVDGTANQDMTNANTLIEWMTDYTNDLAGKTNPFDRALQKVMSRKAFKVIEWINGRAKSNAILGNLNSAVAQVFNLPNGLAYIKDPRDMTKGIADFVAAKTGDESARAKLAQSGFMTERYLDQTEVKFDEGMLNKPKKFATWLLTVGDQQVSELIWYSAYEQAVRKGVSDPVFYADDITKRAVAGRGVGEVPIAQQSKIVKLVAPFQVEVSNAYQLIKEKVGQKDALGLVLLYLSTFLLNEVKEDLTGTRTGMDLIDAAKDAWAEINDPSYKGSTLAKLTTIGGRMTGEVLSNAPFGTQVASMVISDDTMRSKLFGESDPTRFGTGNIGIDALAKPAWQFFSGQEVNPWDTATGLLLPWGGKQVSRAIDMAEDHGLLPVFRVSMDGVRAERQDTRAAYTEDGSKVKFAADKDVGNILKGLSFGRYATDAGKAYLAGGTRGLSEAKTQAFRAGVTEQGIDEAVLYDAIVKLGQAEPVKDAAGKTVITSKAAARKMLFARDDMTPEQKQWLDSVLLIDEDSDQQPADYTDYNSFMLSCVRDGRREAAADALAHGLTIDEFNAWDGRLSALSAEKDADGNKLHSAAEARGMALDEIMQDAALDDNQKQALADYVLISTMSDSQREDWETVAKGNVNASDYVRFVRDTAAYKDEYEKTGADHAANVATILRGYENLTDEQRDYLFRAYSGNMSKNPFHVSEYEQRMVGNGFFDGLSEAGKAEVRKLANQYEQALAEGDTLTDWQGKAYMSKEAGIAPETYILYRVALVACNEDGKGSAKQDEAERAVALLPGLTQAQRAYLYQSTNSAWKSNPYGTATVTKYSALGGTAEAINPVDGGRLSSSFGPRTSPTAGASSWHKAIDIAADEGTPVRSVMGGTVASVNKSGYGGGYGVSVRIDHGNGVETEYHHMQEGSVDALNVGDVVATGQQIGAVGSTGISTGPHLDMQAWKDGQIVDPLTIIPGYGAPSGHVYNGTVRSGVAAGGGSSSQNRSSSAAGTQNGMKQLKKFKPLPTF